MKSITFSHSKINLLLEDIYSYFLNYIYKIAPHKKSNALQIGEAVHYALENDSSDLNSFFKENGTLEQKHSYSYEQALSESLAECYLEQKDEIIKNILGDAKILEEFKEEKFEVELRNSSHKFLGIIDLLLKTDKGWIIVDYKTTSKTPNFDDYLEQLYRYCFLLNRKFGEPIYKIAIISLRKASIRQRANENLESFKRRLVLEYKEKADEYITYHIFDSEKDSHIFNEEVLESYYENLEIMIKMCGDLTEMDYYPINYSKALSVYGKSTFYDFIYWNPENIKNSYYIKDKWYDAEFDEIKDEREITDFDLEIIKSKSKKIVENAIFTYSKFLEVFEKENYDLDVIEEKYLIDNNLLINYLKIYQKKLGELEN